MAVFRWAVVDGTGTYAYDDSGNWILQSGSSGTGFPGSADTALIVGPASGTAQTITGPGSAGELDLSGLSIFAGAFTTGTTRIDGIGTSASLEMKSGLLTASGQILVAEDGTGTLTIDSGATVEAASLGGANQLLIASSTGSDGLVTVEAGGTLDLTGPLESDNYSLVVGAGGAGTLDVMGRLDTGGDSIGLGGGTGSSAAMTVSQGGTVIASTPLNGGNSDAAIAVGRFASDATLTITDPGSSVTANGNMYVGHGGTGTLIVENFGNLTAGATEGGVAGGLGIGSGSTGSGTSRGGTGTATVTSGGTIDDLGALTIGGTGVDGSLGVSDGGKVIATDHIRLGAGATVDGTYYFGAGTLDVNAGGTVDVLGAAHPGTAALSIGYSALGTGTVEVSGAGALVDLGSNSLNVGNYGTALMEVTNGGSVIAQSPGTGYAAISLGSQTSGVGTLNVRDAGTSITAHGAITVGNTGTGTMTVSDGAHVSATNLYVDYAGGTGHMTVIGSGSAVTLSGTLNAGADPASGAAPGTGIGVLAVESGGLVGANAGTLFAGGTLSLGGGTVTTASGLLIESGGLLTGNGEVGGAVTDDGLIATAPGTLVFDGSLAGSGLLDVAGGADVIFQSDVLAGVDLDFIAGSGRIDISLPDGFAGTVDGFQAGDTIFAQGAASISYTGGSSIALFGQAGNEIGTIALSETYDASFFVDNGGTITAAPCFVTGTLIETEAGPVAVEALRIGERVVTASGVARPIRWIGRRAYDGRFIAGNPEMLPIRIRAGAIDDGVPRRDLWVSPHHAMFVDGVLVAAEHLLNGVSITQEEAVESVAYFHIELDEHDILFAEGAPAESFVDCDSRAMFQNAAEFAALYPGRDAPRWQFCAERIEGGPVLERVRARLAQRAGIVPGSIGALRGALDLANRHEVAGWAAGADAEPVALVVTVDGAPAGRILANQYRADLVAAGVRSGRHGFRAALPVALDPARPHSIAIRRAEDGAELPGSPVLLPALPAPGTLAAVPLDVLLQAAHRVGTREVGALSRAGRA